MKFKKDRYIKYRLALALAIALPDLKQAHPDWAETHARNLYDYLNAAGYHWANSSQYWFHKAGTAIKTTRGRKSATAGVPSGRVVKLRIVAHRANFESVRRWTLEAYRNMNFTLLKDSGEKPSKYNADERMCYLTFDCNW